MKKRIDKIIKYILKDFNHKIIFLSKSYTVIEYIKNKYGSKFDSKTKFFTIKKFLENISGLKILDDYSTLLYFFSLLKKDDFIEKKFHDFFNWGPKILNDFHNIDFNLINVEHFFSYIISTEKINKWNLDLLEKKFLFWEKIHEYYYILQSQLFRKGIAYYGMLFKAAIYRLDFFLDEIKDTKIILFLVDDSTFNECEKIFTKKISQQGLVYNLCEKNILKSKYFKKNLNSKVNLQYKYNCLKIIGVSREIEQVKTVENIIYKLIKKKEKKPNKILIIPGDNHLTIPLVHSIKTKLGINMSFNINYPLNDLPIHYTFYSIFQLLLKKNKFKKFTKKDVVTVLSNGYIQKFFLKKNSILKKLNIENDSDFVCESIIKRYLYKNDLWVIFQIPTNNIKMILISLIGFIRKFIKLLITNIRRHFLELKFIFKLEIYIQKLRIIARKNKNFSIGINDVFHMYEQFIYTENIRYVHKNKRGLYITGFKDIFLENFDIVIITSFNEGVIPPNHDNKSFIPFDIYYKKLQINNFNENFYFHHFTRIIQFSKQTYLIYKNQPDEINSGEKSRFIHRMEIDSKINTEKKNKLFRPIFPVRTEKQSIVIYKTKSIIYCLHELIHKGLSPSSIHLYNYNPLLFYYKKILKLNDPEKTSYKKKAGQIIHKILKILYDPIKENWITIDYIHKMKVDYESIIKKVLLKREEIIEGHNMFLYYIIKNYIKNFISWDEKIIKNGHKIFLKEIECEAYAILNIGSKKVNLHGIIDRIDEYDGTIRILDYKIGVSKIKEINISSKNIENIFCDTNYAKIMQLLIYVYLWFKSSISKGNNKKSIIIGIVSPEEGGNILQVPINIQKRNITYADYEINVLPFLIKRISDILDPNIPIIEKIY
ncbi:PD-(D/E)XK nuclease family protein [Blattabacterium cuenoti]|uniref:PD-(D/E)XK nuclease family protein n=1 Tax=Blattabacterium cuenoti TaxID=1653831 RepID=UPI00163CD644|nr:PD-(D/E)XK nuclease family protein [Blattabacterium cuenoti]